MLPQQHRSGYLSPFETQGAPVPLGQSQNSPSRNSGRMDMLSIVDPERRSNASSTYTVTSRNHRGEDYSATNRARDPLEILYCLTDAILIIGALIVVMSLIVTFSIVAIATYRIVCGHVDEEHGILLVLQYIHKTANVTWEDFHFLDRLSTNKRQ